MNVQDTQQKCQTTLQWRSDVHIVMTKITVYILLPLPSWNVNSRSGTQELTACYWTRRTIITSVLTNELRGAILNQVNPIRTHLTFSTSILIITFHLFTNILLPKGLFFLKLSDRLEFASISHFVTMQALQRSSWRSWICASWYNYESNQQDATV